MSTHHLLYVIAVILFVLAALPLNLNVRCEWLAFACLVVAQLV